MLVMMYAIYNFRLFQKFLLKGHVLVNTTGLTLNLLTTTIVAPPSNASKWQMGFNSVFKGLMLLC
jgi:hypothetical protein